MNRKKDEKEKENGIYIYIYRIKEEDTNPDILRVLLNKNISKLLRGVLPATTVVERHEVVVEVVIASKCN